MKKSILLMLLLSVFSVASFADKKALQNDVQILFLGIDEASQGLIYEGTSTGELGTGRLEILVYPFNMTESELHFSASWSFIDDNSGASMTGANSGRLNFGTLAIEERGVVLTCFGELSSLCGCPFRFKGVASDNEFIPNLTTAYGQSSIIVEKDDDCISESDKHKDKHKHKEKDKDKNKNNLKYN
jgi:hypothetical protein